MDAPGSYTCFCTETYTGNTCDQRTPPEPPTPTDTKTIIAICVVLALVILCLLIIGICLCNTKSKEEKLLSSPYNSTLSQPSGHSLAQPVYANPTSSLGMDTAQYASVDKWYTPQEAVYGRHMGTLQPLQPYVTRLELI